MEVIGGGTEPSEVIDGDLADLAALVTAEGEDPRELADRDILASLAGVLLDLDAILE